MTEVWKYIWERFQKNPVLVSIFMLAFVAVPVLSGVIFSGLRTQINNCEKKGEIYRIEKKSMDSILIEYIKSSSKNEGIIETINELENE